MKRLFLSLSVFSIVYGIIMLFTNVTKYFFTVWMAVAIGFFAIYLLYNRKNSKKDKKGSPNFKLYFYCDTFICCITRGTRV